MNRWYLVIFLFCFFLKGEHVANSLIGVKDTEQTKKLPGLNKGTNNSSNKNNKNSNSVFDADLKKSKTNNNVKNNNGIVKTGIKPADVPDFPQYDQEEYKMLFDDGFENVVDDKFQFGEEWDIFVNQGVSNEINKKYIAGNDEEYTQMDAVEAEKKTFIDRSLIDKDNISTYRTRIMAYLNLNQMIFDDVFRTPYGYYLDAVVK